MLQSRMLKAVLLLFVIFSGAAKAFALPLRADGTIAPPEGFDTSTSQNINSFLSPSFTDQYNFEGIIELSNCSGSLMRFAHSVESDYAMVLTNGHCIGAPSFLEPGEIAYKQSSNRKFKIFSKQNFTIGDVQATELTYATMTGTDIAIYKLRETFADIKNRFHVEPLTLRNSAPPVGMPIEVISGYWKRGYNCSVQATIPQLREADWTWIASLKYLQPGCETIGGTSGSPIIEAETRSIVGINNTGNENGQKCTMNNPCEIDEDGNMIVEKGASYGQQTFQIYSCLNENREVDLNVEGCALQKMQ